MNQLADIFFANLNAVYRMGGFFYAPKGRDWSVKDDVFGQNIFYYITEGSCSITINGKTFTGCAGDWFFIPAGSEYSYANQKDQPFAKYWLHFDLYPNLADSGIFAPENIVNCKNHPEVESIFKEFSKICESHRSADIIATKALVLKLLSVFIDLSSHGDAAFTRKTSKELVSLLSFIEDNLHKPLPNEFLAKQLHMQTNHFIRYFKERIGQTPQKYIMAKRMDFAKQLLLNDELSLAEIAERTGFYDSAHFSKNFKAFYSMAPGLYKKYFSAR